MQDLKKFVANHNLQIKDALRIIDDNTNGAVFVIDDDERVEAILTDGDIRRYLLKGGTTETCLRDCANKNFTSVEQGITREQILKILDNEIQILPVLDEKRKLVDVYTRKNFPIKVEKTVIARSKSPVRISFSGGGTDLTQFFVEHGGAVLNTTIAKYSHALLRKRDDSKIIIRSRDLGQDFEFNNLAELSGSKEIALISSVIGLIKPNFGFELHLDSDFPIGSGLGGSAVVLSAVIGCFNEFREDRWDNYEIAELAFQAERLALGIAGGWQDQYATVFGGFNFMEFSQDNNVVHPLRIHPDILKELQSNLLLCSVGKSGRDSGKIIEDQKSKAKADKRILEAIEETKRLTYDMKTHLLRGRLKEFAFLLDRSWELKRQFSSKITDPHIDEIYEIAKRSGAIGGKILGAGGGGYFLFYVEPFSAHTLKEALETRGHKTQNIHFDEEGLQTWKTRQR